LQPINPERGFFRETPLYWQVLADAHQGLGDFEQALEAGRRGCALHPQDAGCLHKQAVALAALGRIEEIWPVLDGIEASTSVRYRRRNLVLVVEALQFYGHIEMAHAVAERVVNWFESRSSDEAASTGHRRLYGRALFLAGRLAESQDVLESLVHEYPESVEFRGLRGVIVATRGDSVQALQDAEWLGELNRPYLRGQHKYWTGAIAGALGDRERAVDLLRQAFTEGQYLYPWSWSSLELDVLRDYPPFQELIRPKG
jgi:tetratricopeptide (TPR) repeat protein